MTIHEFKTFAEARAFCLTVARARILRCYCNAFARWEVWVRES